MRGIQYQFTVDALKVCYRINSEIYKFLTEDTKDQQEIIYKAPNNKDEMTNIFKLFRTNMKQREFGIFLYDNDGKSTTLFGSISIKPDNDEDFAGQCYINLDNKLFYDTYLYLGKKHNLLILITEIAYQLKLDEIISISSLEIAFDSNVNFAKLVKKANRNENLIPVVNRKQYIDINSKDKIGNLGYYYGSTRKRVTNMSCYIKQSKGQLQLKCYNKLQEIKDNNYKKDYIIESIGLVKNIFRMEVTAKREPINDYCKSKGIDLYQFILGLNTQENLIEPYTLWMNRLLHYKIAGKRKGTLSIFDLIGRSL